MSVNSNPNDYGVNMMIGPNTKFIVSTSGRMSSLLRYKKLLQDILKLDIAYISISPQNHNEAISPVDFVNSLKGLNCIGGAISKDIKNSIIPYLDKLDDLAAKTQAVNTVISKNDELHGYNTDAIGFKIAVEKIIEKYPKKIETAICYGYGGVTSVVVWVLKSLGIKTYITGRRLEEAAKRAEELDAYVWSPETWSPGKAELFVNAAPVSDRPLSEGVNFLNSLKGDN
jgi:shikimate 5-dehydrogenase